MGGARRAAARSARRGGRPRRRQQKKRLPAPLAELAARLAEARRPWLALGAGAVGWPNRGALHAALARLARRLDAPLAVLGPGGNARGAWLAGLRPEAGRLDARRALAAPRRLVWLWGVEPEYEAWDAAGAVDHLARSDTVIAAVAYAGPAMRRYADLILPIAAPYETPGSWLNIEGRLARAEAGAPPPGAAREGWRVLAALAARLERPALAFERFEDLAAAAAAAVATAPAGGEPPPAAAPAAAAGGLLRVAAPSPYAWDAVLRRAAPLQATAEGRWARAFHLNPQTAAELGLEAGARVRLEQDGHAWRGELRLDARVAPGCVVTGWGEHERPPLGPAVGPVRLEAGG
ncbi:MAG: hypothetical protein KatS3mg121_1080 [Gammaproteobacteria bacterium]|nr:MAG: hypothetical protein KatS3mg121_1080 [Gammaproteobacteria bacterium]